MNKDSLWGKVRKQRFQFLTGGDSPLTRKG